MSRKNRPIVLKYGGNTLATLERLEVAAEEAVGYVRKGKSVIVVVSAMGDETDGLLSLVSDVNPSASRSFQDMVVQTGEVKAVGLIAAAIEKRGGRVAAFTSQQVGFIGSEEYGNARLLQVRGVKLIMRALSEGRIVVVPGFQAVTDDGSPVTLGRGGSDLTAVALALVQKAEVCVFKKDVDGLSPVDPRLVPDAVIFGELDYDSACDVSQNRVLMDRAIKLAQAYGLPLKVELAASMGCSAGGTLIRRSSTHDALEPEPRKITAVSADSELGLVKILGVPDRPGEAAKLFSLVREISLSDAIQAEGKGENAVISFIVRSARLSETMRLLREKNRRVQGKEGYAAITVIDRDMREGGGYLARVTGALSRVGANISLISTSGSAITVGLRQAKLRDGVISLADEFGLRGKT